MYPDCLSQAHVPDSAFSKSISCTRRRRYARGCFPLLLCLDLCRVGQWEHGRQAPGLVRAATSRLCRRCRSSQQQSHTPWPIELHDPTRLQSDANAGSDGVSGCAVKSPTSRRGQTCDRSLGTAFSRTLLARPWEQREQRTVRTRTAQQLSQSEKEESAFDGCRTVSIMLCET